MDPRCAVRTVSLLLTIGFWVAYGQNRSPRVILSGASSRVAIAIGNDKYLPPGQELKNGQNDARAVANLFKSMGFQVTTAFNLSKVDLHRTVEGFAKSAASADVAIFYYSGHGMQIDGDNYLIPIDFTGSDDTEARYACYPVNQLLERLDAAKVRLKLIILDACRDNPLRGFRGGNRGLAPTGPVIGSGTFIAYATTPGKTASDGNDANGLFTKHLLDSIRMPGITLDQVFNRIRQGVSQESRGGQIPAVETSVIGDFYFYPPSSVRPIIDAPPLVQPKPPTITEFTADAPAVTVGTAVTLKWGVQDATSVVLGPSLGAVQDRGSRRVTPTETTTYTLTSTSAGGSATSRLTVFVTKPSPQLPVIESFSLEPSSIQRGGQSVLRWKVTGAGTVTIEPDVGAVAGSSSARVAPLQSTTFTLTARGPGGAQSAQTTLAVAATVTDQLLEQLEDIHFTLGSVALAAEEAETVLKNADILKALMRISPEMHFLVEGHCDTTGPTSKNEEIGSLRAQEVFAALVRAGIPEEQMQAVSLGSLSPLCSEDTEACNQRNRRVHLSVAQ